MAKDKDRFIVEIYSDNGTILHGSPGADMDRVTIIDHRTRPHPHTVTVPLRFAVTVTAEPIE